MNTIGICKVNIPWPDDNLCRQHAFAFGSDSGPEALDVRILAPQVQWNLAHQPGHLRQNWILRRAEKARAGLDAYPP